MGEGEGSSKKVERNFQNRLGRILNYRRAGPRDFHKGPREEMKNRRSSRKKEKTEKNGFA